MGDHLVIDASLRPPVLGCKRCGAWEPLEFPIPISALAAIERRWRRVHLRCDETFTQDPNSYD